MRVIHTNLYCQNMLVKAIQNLKKTEKMEKAMNIVKAMIPVALGVAAGMLIYEQVKKLTTKA